ncbi:hypothetical protein ABZP36_006112 [Zizania latifolia]
MAFVRTRSNASSGMGVAPDIRDTFLELQMKKAFRYVIFKIEEKQKQVVVEKTGATTESYDDFLASLPENDCRYALYDFDFVTGENVQKSKIFFIAWSPSTSRIRAKMLYSTSKDRIKQELDGFHYEIQATDPSEVLFAYIWESHRALVSSSRIPDPSIQQTGFHHGISRIFGSMEAANSLPPLPCLALLPHDPDPDSDSDSEFDSEKPTLFSVAGEGEVIDVDIDGGLASNDLWATPQGWILVRDAAAATSFLRNPLDSDDKIQLPHLPEEVSCRCTCLLSGEPSLPGCLVLLVEPIATVIWYCHVCGGDEEWARHEYDIGTQLLDPITGLNKKAPIRPIAACRGKFYFNSTLGDIGVLEFSPTPAFSSLKLATRETEGLEHRAQVFLVESEEDLYMINVVYCYGYDITFCETRVHRMDFSHQRWRRAGDLRGRAFLLAPWHFGASCSAGEECGLEEDCVYMVSRWKDSTCVKIYNIRDGEERFMEIPASGRELWILPTNP